MKKFFLKLNNQYVIDMFKEFMSDKRFPLTSSLPRNSIIFFFHFVNNI